jgi:DNA-binding MarR family transcriptional regulator
MLGKDSEKVIRYLVDKEKTKAANYTSTTRWELLEYFSDREKAKKNWIDINFLEAIIDKLEASGHISKRRDHENHDFDHLSLTQDGREYFEVRAKENKITFFKSLAAPIIVSVVIQIFINFVMPMIKDAGGSVPTASPTVTTSANP